MRRSLDVCAARKPIVDGVLVEPPVLADFLTRQRALLSQLVERGLGDLEVFGELVDGQDVVGADRHGRSLDLVIVPRQHDMTVVFLAVTGNSSQLVVVASALARNSRPVVVRRQPAEDRPLARDEGYGDVG